MISVGWSPIDDYVLSGANGELRLLRVGADSASLDELGVFGDQGGRTFVAWSPDGHFALSASTDVRLLAIDRASGTMSQLGPPYAAEQEDIYSLAWSPDGTHALSAGEDGTVRLLAVDTSASSVTELFSFAGQTGKVYGVTWAPDGASAATVNEDGSLRLLAFDSVEGSLHEVARLAEDSWATALAWSPDGSELLTGSWLPCATVKLVSVDAVAGFLQPTSLFSRHPSGVRVVGFRADGELGFSAGHDDTVRLFAFSGPSRTLEHIATWEDNAFGVHEVSWSPDGTRLLVAASHRDRLTLLDASQCASP